MSVVIDQTCQLCGHPVAPFEGRVHSGCQKDEEFLGEYDPKGSDETCDLCGEPSSPFERRTHAACATYEKIVANA